MRYEDKNIWLTQKMMATLYDVGTNTINYHIKKRFEVSADKRRHFGTYFYLVQKVMRWEWKEQLKQLEK